MITQLIFGLLELFFTNAFTGGFLSLPMTFPSFGEKFGS